MPKARNAANRYSELPYGAPTISKNRLGELTPRYSFILNAYPETRQKCPRCEQNTFLRKFPLFIHIDDWGPLVLGKTCRYCAKCELIMVHQHELEDELAHGFEQRAPAVIGNEYMVMGTVDKKVWQNSLSNPTTMDEILNHLAEDL